ncbi:helix-turn-helix domain-containing protein [Mycolicibacterium elephantis]|uniref:helix-turn-helix transcriptional regulator n=1 Tax=Mycolicibacterium elephantis TaxID=81858 RepID=UPI003A86CA50
MDARSTEYDQGRPGPGLTNVSINERRGGLVTPNELLGLQEASALLGICPNTLRWYRATGMGPKSFKVGRRIRYWRHDCLEWLAAQESATSVGGVR